MNSPTTMETLMNSGRELARAAEELNLAVTRAEDLPPLVVEANERLTNAITEVRRLNAAANQNEPEIRDASFNRS